MNDAIFQTQSHDYAIGGKMVVGRAEMTEDFRMMLEDGDATAIMQIKEKLTRDLVILHARE
jgi:hypothetical protein